MKGQEKNLKLSIPSVYQESTFRSDNGTGTGRAHKITFPFMCI
jgi:hypothetical protein